MARQSTKLNRIVLALIGTIIAGQLAWMACAPPKPIANDDDWTDSSLYKR